ncbi:MAG TPA: hypothetical protein VG694_00410 [Candidatus Paceibacterota bacterium]|jgi:hypothetical protein|nr:hypothetical protein [Candidatus Paceibacterota bacterium]
MEKQNYFLLPVIKNFQYIKGEELWNNIFSTPVPFNYRKPSKGSIKLSNYFDLYPGPCMNGSETVFIKENKRLINSGRAVTNSVLTALCDFICRYNRPFWECHVYVPPHPDVVPDDVFWPMELFYHNNPSFPSLDKKNNLLTLLVDEEVYRYVFAYTTGETPGRLPEETKILVDLNDVSGFLVSF